MREHDEALARLLPAFLPRQRWFGGKARTITACEIEDAADLTGGLGDVALVVAGVAYGAGPRERYAMLLSCQRDAKGLPALGRLEESDGNWLVEAATDPDAVRTLLRAMAEGARIGTRRGGTLSCADLGDAARLVLTGGTPTVKAVGAEQSNTSLRVGSTLVLKLFRRLEDGENPELEVGRFLTSRTTFRAMSALEGSLTYHPPDGEPATLGVLQTWVDNQGDGWSYVLSGLDAHVRTGTPPPGLMPDIRRLGVITADFHAALESDARLDAFRPEPVQPGDVDAWSRELRDRLSRACALIGSRYRDWPEETRRLGTSILAKSHVAEAMAAASGDARASFRKIRIHGDYHLGQTLKTPSGFALIDFEGEPARPIADRRQKQCALKDVAGMLRSFEYAIDTAAGDSRETADRLRASPGLRDAFLDGYFQSAASHAVTSIPFDQQTCARWLTFFELEKALYELEYEINNRPAWAHIPLRGILRALDAAA